MRTMHVSLYLVIVLLSAMIFFSSCVTESTTPFDESTAPEIYDWEVWPSDSVGYGDSILFRCKVRDFDGDPLTYSWYADHGTFDAGTEIDNAMWRADSVATGVLIELRVSDSYHEIVERDSVRILSPEEANRAPVIDDFYAVDDEMGSNDTTDVFCEASDFEDDTLNFVWTSTKGEFIGSGEEVRWTPAGETGLCSLRVAVSDENATTNGLITIDVYPDTLILLSQEFETDQVTGNWEFTGLLTGLGTDSRFVEVGWDSTRAMMTITARALWATQGFSYTGRNFGDGTFSAHILVPNTQYGGVGFIPKYIDGDNYIYFGINFYQQAWFVLRCVNGTLQYLEDDWATFQANIRYELKMVQADGMYTIFLAGNQVWQNTVVAPFDGELPMGVGMYGLEDSNAAYFDNIEVTVP
ncbi:hypothetical protein K8I28_05700 [bacterium]|nr:hypothetical protein [bacterium]